MSPFTITTVKKHRRHRRINKKRNPKVILFSLLGVFGLWYLIAANAVVAESYRLSDTEAKKTELSQNIEALRASLAAASAPDTIESKAEALGFAPVTSPVYLAIPGTAVAQR